MNQNEIKLQELYSETLAELVKIPVGEYSLNNLKAPWFIRMFQRNKGWLSVKQGKDGIISLSVTSHSDTHNLFWGQAKFIDIFKSKGEYFLLSYMSTALSLHLKWGYGTGSEIDLAEAFEFSLQILSSARRVGLLK